MWRHVALRNYGNSFGMLMFGAKKSPKRAKIIQCNTNKSERFNPSECKVNYSATLELVSPPPPPTSTRFGVRSLSAAGPQVWNGLPSGV